MNLWQPSPLMVDTCWTTTEHPTYYNPARQLLRAVNTYFVYHMLNGWGIRELDQPRNIRRLLFVDAQRTPISPPGCTCPQYTDEPLRYPRSLDGQRTVAYCRHTLAYEGYRRLLGLMLTQNGYIHKAPRDLYEESGFTYQQGLYQPRNQFHLYQTSLWLQRQLQQEQGEKENASHSSAGGAQRSAFTRREVGRQ